jgi:hypothetical protein
MHVRVRAERFARRVGFLEADNGVCVIPLQDGKYRTGLREHFVAPFWEN